MTHSSDTTLTIEGQQSVTEMSSVPTSEVTEQSNVSQRLIYQHLSHGRQVAQTSDDDTA